MRDFDPFEQDVCTGLTPEAVGGWLRPSDEVVLTIERLGTLRNRLVERRGGDNTTMP